MNANLEEIAGPPTTGKTEFIDHTFLAPAYIRDSSTYIMELIDEHQFPKTVVEVQADPITTAVDAYSLKDSLPGDINFPNSLFQFVEQKADANTTAGGTLGTAKTNGTATNTTTNTTTDFITLNGDFLNTNEGVVEATVSSGVGEFNALALPADLGAALEDSQGDLTDPDVLYHRLSSRKVLPHKKRISRKLKGSGSVLIGNGCESPPPMAQTTVDDRLTSDCAMRYSCELCGCQAASQLDFFAHLKQHYEPPTTPDTILAAMKTSLDSLEPDKHICVLKKPDDPVFQDVALNFVDFPAEVVSSPVVAQVLHGTVSHDDDMKILANTTMQKCMNFVTTSDDASLPLKSLQVDEVEFSDTEDMLEGIRNVVDKVSIEDTCDDIELMTATNGMPAATAAWFTNDLEFHKKSYGDLTFAGALEEATLNHSTVDEGPPTNEVVAKTEQHAADTYNPDFKNFNGSDSHSHGYTDGYDEAIDKNVVGEEIEIAYADPEVEDFDDNLQEYIDAPSKLPRRRKAPKSADATSLHFCTQCQRGFNSKNALKYHTRTHMGVRPHQCDVCGKSFFALSALKSHIRTHTGDKPYECAHCKRKFRQNADLRYHLASLHSDEKSYVCEFCGKAFSRKYSLQLHRRTHTLEKNYKCEHCDKAFIASTYLKDHQKIHTGEKPFQCKVCQKKFRVWGDLNRHKVIHERHKLKAPQQKRSSLTSDNIKLIETIELEHG